MRQKLAGILMATAWLGAISVADAHFLFIRIGQHAEAGRTCEVFFSERAEAGDPRFIAKVAHTKLWLQTEPAKFEPLAVQQAPDRLRAFLPTGKSAAVIGECEYGVLKRDVSFLLRYYPKAMSGRPEELARLKPRPEIPLEIVGTVEGDSIGLVLLQKGQPTPNAIFTTIDADLVNEELKADANGRAVWKPSAPGPYAVYAKLVTPGSGTKDGVNFSETREFATLAFEWPLGSIDAQSEAVAMFEKALAARAAWGTFPGFSADIGGQVDGRNFKGQVTVSASGEVKLNVDDETTAPWVEEQLQSIVTHRQASTTPADRPRPVLRFADNDTNHPLGRLVIFFGGRFASSYRIRGDEILVVNRNIGPENMSITVLDNDRNVEGKYLPRSYTVQYWDASSGGLKRVETFQNRWKRVGQLDLPESLTFWASSGSGLGVRNFALSNHKLLP